MDIVRATQLVTSRCDPVPQNRRPIDEHDAVIILALGKFEERTKPFQESAQANMLSGSLDGMQVHLFIKFIEHG